MIHGKSGALSIQKWLVLVAVAAVILILLLWFVIPLFVPRHVCVERSITSDSTGQLVHLRVQVSGIQKSAFLVEDRFAPGLNASVFKPEPLVYDGETGKVAWLFWRGGLAMKDTSITYRVSAGEAPVGRLITAVDPTDPVTKYKEQEIRDVRVCL